MRRVGSCRWGRIHSGLLTALGAVAALSVVAVLATASTALAFDTGPHSELTSDALTAEGFGADAVDLVRVNNWFCDLYEQAEKNPFSGQGSLFKRVLVGAFTTENWPDSVVEAAFHCHFDESALLSNTAGVTEEWDRLRRAVWTLAREARDRNDPEELLAVLGISLHELQDFYSHTNWVESRPGHGVPGSDGPGWQERGFGSNPTWFEVPPAERYKYTIYSDELPGKRAHGYWNTDGNRSMASAMNKDWPGRPYYLQAATTAYFATRQWVEAVRLWVDDDAFWNRALHFHADRRQLDHDLEGMFNISLYLGHWQGQGEPFGGTEGPGGSLLDARQAIKGYFQPPYYFGPLRTRTKYRSRFESLIKRVQEWRPAGQLGPVPSTQNLQRSMRMVVLRISEMRGEGLGDPGHDQADMYAQVSIDGQKMSSAVINDEDSYSFPKPNAPFTWLKAVPAVPEQAEPVESVEVEVKTADASWAGTDDDVFLRLGPGLRFPLDKRLYNDFESGDRDTYSVPIDGVLADGLGVGGIREVQIEKSGDGLAGGWKLGGVKLRVNGVQLYDNQHINRWLEDDHRNWTAPDFERRTPRGPNIPIWLNLREHDLIYGGDDQGDINPYDGRDTVSVGYRPGTALQRTTRGGNRLGGRLGSGGDGASITYGLTTITPELMHVTTPEPEPTPEVVPGTPGTPPGKPDLVITAFNLNGITVANHGVGDAGPFRLKAAQGTWNFSGLEAGESETLLLSLSCAGTFFAQVDDLEQVDESNELNNTAESAPAIC